MSDSDSTPEANATHAVDELLDGVVSTPGQTPEFKDRKAGLIVFGIVELLIGLALLGIAAFQVAMIFASESLVPQTVASPSLFAFSAVFYALLAAGAVWLGIGSIQCRRWARALTLVFSSMGLAVGVMGSIMMVSMSKALLSDVETEIGGANAGASFIVGCMFVGMAFFYLILPAAFVLFYRSRHVKATCERYDPKPRWTDRYPLPLLAGGLLLLSMVGVLVVPFIQTPLPFFGMILTGPLVWIYAIAVAITAGVLSWGFFRLERWAWLGTVVLMALSGFSVFFSFRGQGLLRLYEKMNLPPEQLEKMKESGILATTPLLTLVSLLALLGFYLWLGRYFGRTKTA